LGSHSQAKGVYGCLGIRNLAKFTSAFCIRWLWHEWDDEAKPWAGLGNHCTLQDKELFAAVTKVTIGDGKKAILGGTVASWEADQGHCTTHHGKIKMEEMYHQQSHTWSFLDHKMVSR
jgi:hypothetical protein